MTTSASSVGPFGKSAYGMTSGVAAASSYRPPTNCSFPNSSGGEGVPSALTRPQRCGAPQPTACRRPQVEPGFLGVRVPRRQPL